ncbi:hypothetical protein KBC55_00295 [Patescibacteria group bacterium]|nr:hypothetical protein [Patescibacteria group bacterium]
MPSVTRTITPEQRRRALMVGIFGGLAVVTLISFQVVVTLTKPPTSAPPSAQETETNGRLINGMDSLKESVTGLKGVTQEAWDVAQDEVQNQ